MTGFEGAAVSQGEGEELISGLFLCFFVEWAAGLCAFALCGRAQMCLISNFGDMWGTLTISVCTLWLGLFWTRGGWWSPQPSHPEGGDRWRVVVHHQHERTKCHAYWYTNFIQGSSNVVEHMKTTYVVYIGWSPFLALDGRKKKKTSYPS